MPRLRPCSIQPLLLLLLGVVLRAEDRMEIIVRSRQPWTLALAEGVRAGRGTLSLMDKFTGKPLGTLAKAGDSVVLPAQGRVLLVFNRKEGYLYQDFLLKDIFGYYAEYVASVEFLANQKISIQLVDKHLGPPLDTADEETSKQFVKDSIEIGSDNIVIHPNTMGKFTKEDMMLLNLRKINMDKEFSE